MTRSDAAATMEHSSSAAASGSRLRQHVRTTVDPLDILYTEYDGDAGRTYFSCFARAGNVYQVGDTVLLSGDDEESPYICYIQDCWCSFVSDLETGARVFDPSVYFTAIWYYRVKDIPCKNSLPDDDSMLCFSTHSDENNTDTLLGPAQVVFFQYDLSEAAAVVSSTSPESLQLRRELNSAVARGAFKCGLAYDAGKRKLRAFSDERFKAHERYSAIIDQRLARPITEQLKIAPTPQERRVLEARAAAVEARSAAEAALAARSASAAKKAAPSRRSTLKSRTFRIADLASWRKFGAEWHVSKAERDDSAAAITQLRRRQKRKEVAAAAVHGGRSRPAVGAGASSLVAAAGKARTRECCANGKGGSAAKRKLQRTETSKIQPHSDELRDQNMGQELSKAKKVKSR